MGAASPRQVAGLLARGHSGPGPSVSCVPPAGRLQDGESPPAAQQLSVVKNEMGREIHKLWF